jgi:hypothetical protein
MTLSTFVESIGEASNGVTKRICGRQFNCIRHKEFAIAQAKTHLYHDFAVVGIAECFPETMGLIADVLPWCNDAGGLKEVHKNHHSTGKALSIHEAELILSMNSWDTEVYEFGLRLYHGALRRNADLPMAKSTHGWCNRTQQAHVLEAERLQRERAEADAVLYLQDTAAPQGFRIFNRFGPWEGMSSFRKSSWKTDYDRRQSGKMSAFSKNYLKEVRRKTLPS